MEEMDFTFRKAHLDVWLRPALKVNGVEYYQYILLYTGNILAIMEEPERFLREDLSKWLTLKEKSIGSPEQYLENKVWQVTLENSTKYWNFSPLQHVQAAVKNIKDYRIRNNLSTLPKSKLSWSTNYCLESDIT